MKRQLTINFLRMINTEKIDKRQENEILSDQSAVRPRSPFYIYKPQLTTALSILHRVSGIYMATFFYGLSCTYAITSLFDYPFSSGDIVKFFEDLPKAFKILIKMSIVYSFIGHFANGVRHLIWDTGKCLSKNAINKTSYLVVGFTAIFGTYCTFFR